MGVIIGVILLFILSRAYKAKRKKINQNLFLNTPANLSSDDERNIILKVIEEQRFVLFENETLENGGFKISFKEKFKFGFHWPTIINLEKSNSSAQTSYQSYGEQFSLTQSSHDDKVTMLFLERLYERFKL